MTRNGLLQQNPPPEAELVRLANIVTGRDRTPEQSLPPGHVVVKQLEPYLCWLHRHLHFHQSLDLNAIDWFQRVVHFFSDDRDAKLCAFVQAQQSNFPAGKGPDFVRRFTLACTSYWLTIDILHRAIDDVQETRPLIKNCVADLSPRLERAIRAGDISLKELTYNGRLIPHAGTYTDPLKQINAMALNVHRLVKFGRLHVKWTSDISRHLEIVEEQRELLLFYLPCILTAQDAFPSTNAVKVFHYYIPEQLTNEISRSYWLLFGSSRKGRKSFRHALKGDRETDAAAENVLQNLCIRNNERDTVWARDKFVYLWPRILELKSHLDSSEPESWWGLIWHDKSQPYVFVPAMISGILFLLALASTGATIAQTWKAFQDPPSSGPGP